jgi:acid phosphatase (class A)
LPDSLALLPPPPAAGSAAFAADEQTYRSTRALRGTPRWALAAQDASLTPDKVDAFSCALGIPITQTETPHLFLLMRRALTDGVAATSAAKNHYQRRRPFMEFNEQTCLPEDEARLRTNGSYPSGHSALGWTWALVLSELAPDRMNEILQRGYAYGQSRVVCGAHWQSDVTEGRVVAAAVVARLHDDPTFNADMQSARKEIAAARAGNARPARDCAAEAAALAAQAP